MDQREATRLTGRLTEGGEGGVGSSCTQIGYGRKCPVQVPGRLGVNDHDLTARFDPPLQHRIGIVDHQMRFDVHRDVLAIGSNNAWAEGDVGHEPAIHHIPLDPVNSRLLQLPYFLAEL